MRTNVSRGSQCCCTRFGSRVRWHACCDSRSLRRERARPAKLALVSRPSFRASSTCRASSTPKISVSAGLQSRRLARLYTDSCVNSSARQRTYSGPKAPGIAGAAMRIDGRHQRHQPSELAQRAAAARMLDGATPARLAQKPPHPLYDSTGSSVANMVPVELLKLTLQGYSIRITIRYNLASTRSTDEL